MRWRNDKKPSQIKQNKNNHRLLNPVPFVCRCGNTPSVAKTTHPDTGKAGYYVVRCHCGHHSIYAKQRYNVVLDWNIKPISQDPDQLYCPGLNLDDITLHDAVIAIKEAQQRLEMVLNDQDRPRMEPEQWHLLKAKRSWYQMLITVAKRRLNALENPPTTQCT